MNCEQFKSILDYYVDNEIDALTGASVELHLAQCAACRARADAAQALKQHVAHAQYHRAPANLRSDLRSRLKEADRTPSTVPEPLRWSGIVALAATIAFVAWTLLPQGKQTFTPLRSERVVYHINNNKDVLSALRNVTQHLEASPKARVVVVAHNNGVEFLLDGAKDATGVVYENEVAKLNARGVDFRVCKNTLVRRKIDLAKVIPEADLVPSGIAEISRLQAVEGYAYVKP